MGNEHSSTPTPTFLPQSRIDELFESSARGDLDIEALKSIDGYYLLRDISNCSLVDVALEHKQVKLAMELLTIMDHPTRTSAFTSAAKAGSIEVLIMLLLTMPAIDSDVHLSALRAACEKGHCDVVRLFLCYHGLRDNFNHALRDACKYGHAEVAQMLIDAGADAHLNPDGEFIADVMSPYTGTDRDPIDLEPVLDVLVSAGAVINPHIESFWGYFDGFGMGDPFPVPVCSMKVMLAHGVHEMENIDRAFEGMSCAGRKDMIEYLLEFCDEHGYQVDSRKYLAKAFLSEEFSTARLFLDRIHDTVDLSSATEANKFMCYAAGCGKVDLLSRLLDDGNCKVNALVEDGDDEWHVRKYSPLSQASDPAIIKILLEAKANVNPKKGDCALRGACTMLRPDAVKMLIDAGANVNATARGGMTPLLYALEAKCAVEQADDIIQVVKLLLDAGAKTFGAIPPLHKCTNPNEPRRLGALKVLLERDQSMAYDVDASGRNVIMCAAMSHTKSPSALSVLIDAGVDLNDLGHKDKPALFYVFRYLDKVWKGMRLPRHVRDCLQMLLRAGADPTILDGDWTLLMDLLGYEDPYMFYANVFTDNTMRILISDIADSILQRPVGSDVKKSADTALDTDSAKTSLPVVSENADDSSSEENEQLRRKRFKSAKQ